MHLAAQSGCKRQPGCKRRWVFPLSPGAGDQDASGCFSLPSVVAVWMGISEAHLLLYSSRRLPEGKRKKPASCGWWMWFGSLSRSGCQLPEAGEQHVGKKAVGWSIEPVCWNGDELERWCLQVPAKLHPCKGWCSAETQKSETWRLHTAAKQVQNLHFALWLWAYGSFLECATLIPG